MIAGATSGDHTCGMQIDDRLDAVLPQPLDKPSAQARDAPRPQRRSATCTKRIDRKQIGRKLVEIRK